MRRTTCICRSGTHIVGQIYRDSSRLHATPREIITSGGLLRPWKRALQAASTSLRQSTAKPSLARTWRHDGAQTGLADSLETPANMLADMTPASRSLGTVSKPERTRGSTGRPPGPRRDKSPSEASACRNRPSILVCAGRLRQEKLRVSRIRTFKHCHCGQGREP